MEELMNKAFPLPLNLQFFAEGGETTPGGTGAPDPAGAEGAGNEGGEGTPAGSAAAVKPDLNALLKGDKELQSQFDKLVAKAMTTAKGKWEKEQTMTAEQLAAEKAKEHEDALTAREKEIERRERKASALELLGQKGLPVSLLDCVALEDDAIMAKTVEQAEKAFRASVEEAVKQKLAGGTPKATGGGTDAYAAQIRAAMGLKK